jgi:hypothetical protein
VLLPVSVLERRADAATVIGAALVLAASGLGHRLIAQRLGRPAATVRCSWLITAEGVIAQRPDRHRWQGEHQRLPGRAGCRCGAGRGQDGPDVIGRRRNSTTGILARRLTCTGRVR